MQYQYYMIGSEPGLDPQLKFVSYAPRSGSIAAKSKHCKIIEEEDGVDIIKCYYSYVENQPSVGIFVRIPITHPLYNIKYFLILHQVRDSTTPPDYRIARDNFLDKYFINSKYLKHHDY